MRNPELVKKLVYLGANVDSIDDQGRGVFHILFSVFNKQIAKCILIGDFLLSFNCQINKLDNDGWGPIHLASKRGCKECLLWVISRNKKLKKEGREEFNLNLKGKHYWTPLHLAVFSLRIEETMILLEHGCDIFARNLEAQTPKQVSISNFVFSKLLSYCEFLTLNKKYYIKIVDIYSNEANPGNNIYNTILNEESVFEENKSNITKNDISSSLYDDNIINNSVTISSNVKKTVNKENDNSENKNINLNRKKLKNKSENNLNKKIKIKKGKTYMIKENNKKINKIKSSITFNNNFHNTSSKDIFKTFNNISIKENNTSNIKRNKNQSKKITKYKNIKNYKIEELMKENIAPKRNEMSFKANNTQQNLTKELNSLNSTGFNNYLDIQKDKLLNSDSSNIEKIQAFMEIKLSDHCDNDIIKNILDNIVNENPMNIILFSDICNYVIANMIFSIIPTLKDLLENKVIINKNYIKKELEETVKILENLKKKDKNWKFTKKSKRSPINQKNKKIYSNEDAKNSNMFYQNSEEINNSDDIEEFDNNLNFEEIDDIFKSSQYNINNSKSNQSIKNNNASKNNRIYIITNQVNAEKGNLLDKNNVKNIKNYETNIKKDINNRNRKISNNKKPLLNIKNATKEHSNFNKKK